MFGSVQREPRPTRNQRCFQDKVDVKTLKNKSVMDQFLNYKTGVACGANAMRKVLPKMYSQPRRGPNKQSPYDYKAPSFPTQGRTSNPHLQTGAVSRSQCS